MYSSEQAPAHLATVLPGLSVFSFSRCSIPTSYLSPGSMGLELGEDGRLSITPATVISYSIPSRYSFVGNVAGVAVGTRVFSGLFCFPRSCISSLLHRYLIVPSPVLETNHSPQLVLNTLAQFWMLCLRFTICCVRTANRTGFSEGSHPRDELMAFIADFVERRSLFVYWASLYAGGSCGFSRGDRKALNELLCSIQNKRQRRLGKISGWWFIVPLPSAQRITILVKTTKHVPGTKSRRSLHDVPVTFAFVISLVHAGIFVVQESEHVLVHPDLHRVNGRRNSAAVRRRAGQEACSPRTRDARAVVDRVKRACVPGDLAPSACSLLRHARPAALCVTTWSVIVHQNTCSGLLAPSLVPALTDILAFCIGEHFLEHSGGRNVVAVRGPLGIITHFCIQRQWTIWAASVTALWRVAKQSGIFQGFINASGCPCNGSLLHVFVLMEGILNISPSLNLATFRQRVAAENPTGTRSTTRTLHASSEQSLRVAVTTHFICVAMSLSLFPRSWVSKEPFFQWSFGVKEPDFYGAIAVLTGKALLFAPKLPESYAVWMGKLHSLADFKDMYSVDEVHYVHEVSWHLNGTRLGGQVCSYVRGRPARCPSRTTNFLVKKPGQTPVLLPQAALRFPGATFKDAHCRARGGCVALVGRGRRRRSLIRALNSRVVSRRVATTRVAAHRQLRLSHQSLLHCKSRSGLALILPSFHRVAFVNWCLLTAVHPRCTQQEPVTTVQSRDTECIPTTHKRAARDPLHTSCGVSCRATTQLTPDYLVALLACADVSTRMCGPCATGEMEMALATPPPRAAHVRPARPGYAFTVRAENIRPSARFHRRKLCTRVERLARRGDGTLGTRVTVARIARLAVSQTLSAIDSQVFRLPGA
ncbi:hypothetical protein PR048_017894 [Dryococelus australis]|uniref:Aminopeptidase P N-terminal domain-containing protein n=1 Tax=Dryococelus australis TaxID=614101 RepID=A0ABQ9HAQ6_9NEOP|nr:hypothetical protein PR048_017894 [Dryococelus australis]